MMTTSLSVKRLQSLSLLALTSVFLTVWLHAGHSLYLGQGRPYHSVNIVLETGAKDEDTTTAVTETIQKVLILAYPR